jgi:hypothetical protein
MKQNSILCQQICQMHEGSQISTYLWSRGLCFGNFYSLISFQKLRQIEMDSVVSSKERFIKAIKINAHSLKSIIMCDVVMKIRRLECLD